jgi:2-dehydro-3-deoxy-D-gluconate 5-dehydrogenase
MSDIDQVLNVASKIARSFDLSGKAALVVGGSRGLGQAMALALAGAGADVCVVSNSPEGLQETAEAVGRLGRRGEAVVADVTVEEEVRKLSRGMIDRFGRVDILVNSQGAVHLAPTDQFETERWEHVMDVNVKSVFLCCKHVGGLMLSRAKGKIINVSSVRGFQGRAMDPAYAPSKGAVNQLTRSLAIEWGSRGINVNAIAPVFTVTAVSKAFLDDPENRDWVLSRIPMKRLGQLEDLLGPVVFLAAEASNFINGHILPVDGGWLSA